MKDVVILGGGPSVKEGIEKGLWDKIKDKEVWSLNFAYKAIPFKPKREIWVDGHFFTTFMEELEALAESGVEMHTKRRSKYANYPEIITHDSTRKKEEFDSKIFIGEMGLVGFFALSLAVRENYDNIYLLGYDFGTVGGKKNTNTHFYQDRGKELGISEKNHSGLGKPDVYCGSKGGVRSGVQDFDVYLKYPSKIYNVSLVSHIHSFERISYDDFFSKINCSNLI